MELKELIRETVRETVIRESVKRMVRKRLYEALNEGMFEADKGDSGRPQNSPNKAAGEQPSQVHDPKDKPGYHPWVTEDNKEKALSQLCDILEVDSANNDCIIMQSKIAYAVFPDVDEDSARSMFLKLLKGERPSTPQQLNTAFETLHSMGVSI